MKPGTLINIAFFKARQGSAGKLESALLGLVEPTRQEPGCLQYDICKSPGDPHDVVVFERWRAPDDFDAHMGTPYVVDFMGKVPDLCGSDVEIRTYQMISAPAEPKR